jgi:hypothetical protein
VIARFLHGNKVPSMRRIFHPPVEGRLLYGLEGVDAGSRHRVQLIHTDVEKGYIDFKKINKGKSS